MAFFQRGATGLNLKHFYSSLWPPDVKNDRKNIRNETYCLERTKALFFHLPPKGQFLNKRKWHVNAKLPLLSLRSGELQLVYSFVEFRTVTWVPCLNKYEKPLF